jgi:hypothetical protein
MSIACWHYSERVAPGTGFPVIESEAYGYRFTNEILTEAGRSWQTRTVTAHYVYDESMNPKSAGYAVVVEPSESCRRKDGFVAFDRSR